MKKRIICLIFIMLLSVSLTIPAFAAIDRSQIPYDSSDYTWTEEAGEANLYYITDDADFLSDSEDQELEGIAERIAEQYQFGVYTVIVDDYTEFGEGDIFSVATSIYKDYSLGIGELKEGVMLLLSMSERDYCMIAHGPFANYAFDDEGRSYLADYFLVPLGENEWYEAILTYLTWSEEYIIAADNGEPYNASNIPLSDEERIFLLVAIICGVLLVSLIVTAIVMKVLNNKMKSVQIATRAVAYISGNLVLTGSDDSYGYTSETRRYIEKNKSSSSKSSHSSGGFSGTSGKF